MLAGPFQHFKGAGLAAWRGRAAGIHPSCWEGFRGGPLLDYKGSKQLLSSSCIQNSCLALHVIAVPGSGVLPGMAGYLLYLLVGCISPGATSEVDSVDGLPCSSCWGLETRVGRGCC